jgi:HK97 family phage prohead protease
MEAQMLIRKTLSLSEVNLKADDAGSFSGYASVFGGVDAYGDTIEKGAFIGTLKKNGMPKMFFNHRWDFPIGKYLEAKEDDTGLRVTGQLTDGVALSADVRAAMKHGTIDGLSIAGFIAKDDYKESDTGRIIRKWTQLVEISPVVFPADSAARINPASVKHAMDVEALEADIQSLENLRDLEYFLRESGGLTKGLAQGLVSRVKAILLPGEPDLDGDTSASLKQLSERISRLADSFGETK